MNSSVFARASFLVLPLLVGGWIFARSPLMPLAPLASAQDSAVPNPPAVQPPSAPRRRGNVAEASAEQSLQSDNVLWVHDPSRLIKSGALYHFFHTGDGVPSRSSSDGRTWKNEPPIFDKLPDWTAAAVPDHRGNGVWAPDVVFFNNKFWLFYSVSTFGARVSAIGLATNPTLDTQSPDYKWTDGGMVISSNRSSGWNAIDPGPIVNSNGELWLSFGSFGRGGIQLVKLDSQTGKPVGAPKTLAAGQGVGPEAPYIHFHNGFYYLFQNEGFCCRGLNSTYEVTMGRSQTIDGPYLDKTGRDLAKGGGSPFLRTEGEFVGPGHIGILGEGNLERFSFHYYGSRVNGVPTLGLRTLVWDKDGWPRPATELKPARYGILSKISRLGLGVAKISQDEGAPLDQFTFDGGPFQTWNIAPVGDGTYSISNIATGKVMDLFNGSAANGTKISQYPWFGNDAQMWRIEPTSDGFYRVLSKGTGTALTLPNGDKAPLAQMQGFAPSGGDEQEWEFRPSS